MRELITEALVTASPEIVWAEWTQGSLLAEWFWPPRLEALADIDIEAGTWVIVSDVADIGVLGAVVSADAPRELRIEWQWRGEERKTLVAVGFEPAADDSTHVIVRQTGFATDEERESHIEGWTHCLDRLVARHAA